MRPFHDTIDAFVAAFNRNDLDAVMRHFAADAVYEPGDGAVHRGPAAIRKAFAPQFAGAYGRMCFDEHDRLIDEPARKLCIRWTCRHDLDQGASRTLLARAQHAALRLIWGKRFGWEGVDIFHFDTQGLICGKYTYAHYPLPRFSRGLG